MNRVQRKYRILKSSTSKELQEKVNDLIQKEYKDTEGLYSEHPVGGNVLEVLLLPKKLVPNHGFCTGRKTNNLRYKKLFRLNF